MDLTASLVVMPAPAGSPFASRAASAFAFLISDHDFQGRVVRSPQVRTPAMVGEDFEEVRFESSMVFVSIWRCPSRLEWDVEVGLRQQPHQDGFSVVSDIV